LGSYKQQKRRGNERAHDTFPSPVFHHLSPPCS
jgi:hypothetical protein